MRDVITDLANWPHRRSGQPILKSSNEALFYAQLVYNNPKKMDELVFYRKRIYQALRAEREKRSPNFQNMMDMAVRAQLFREAFMEAARIQDEISKTEGG